MPRTWIIGPFRDYADRVAGSCRFGLDQDTKDFIGEVSATAERNVLQIEPGHKFWRAQLGHDNIVGVRCGRRHRMWAAGAKSRRWSGNTWQRTQILHQN